MHKKMLLLFAMCVLVFTPVAFSSDQFEKDFQSVEKIFQEIIIGKPLPDVSYVYLPKEKTPGIKEYEGRLGRVNLTVGTNSNGPNGEIVNTCWFSIQNGAAGEDYLSLITRYFGKPTTKVEGKDSKTKYPVYVNMAPNNEGWILFTGPDWVILNVQSPPKLQSATDI